MRRRRALLLAATAVTVLLVGVCVIVFNGSRSSTDFRAATLTASSAVPGYSPVHLLDTGMDAGEWRSDAQTVGAWVELSWPRAQSLHSLTLTAAATGARVASGALQFGDGSRLQVDMSSGTVTTLVFGERTARSVRFTVTSVGQAGSFVGLGAIALNASPSSVVTDPSGDAVLEANVTTGGARLPAGSRWRLPTSQQILFRWSQPREIAAVELAGTSDGASVTSASVGFRGGGSIEVGAVRPDPGLPTRVAFMPRVTDRLVLTVEGDAHTIDLTAVHLWERGAELPTAHSTTGTETALTPAEDCGSTVQVDQGSSIRVLCPTNGNEVEGRTTLVVAVPDGGSGLRAEVLPATGDGDAATTEVAGDGVVRMRLDLDDVPSGPFTVRLTATGLPVSNRTSVSLQLFRGGAGTNVSGPSSAATHGRTLVWDEEFSSPVSATRTGIDAVYSAAKPETGGYSDFGDAYFADPADGLGNLTTLDDRYLRIGVDPVPNGWQDPAGYGRTRTGGMLASAHPGGSGFSAQYGYFEARMLVPANPGTWPAFWMLPTPNLISAREPVAEIDAVELYGHDPVSACHTTHSYAGGKDSGGGARCGERFASERQAAEWHIFAVQVDPTIVRFFIDGREVATSPQVRGGGDPMFFLLDLALGGGWPVELDATGQRAQMLVDWVRVYV